MQLGIRRTELCCSNLNTCCRTFNPSPPLIKSRVFVAVLKKRGEFYLENGFHAHYWAQLLCSITSTFYFLMSSQINSAGGKFFSFFFYALSLL